MTKNPNELAEQILSEPPYANKPGYNKNFDYKTFGEYFDDEGQFRKDKDIEEYLKKAKKYGLKTAAPGGYESLDDRRNRQRAEWRKRAKEFAANNPDNVYASRFAEIADDRNGVDHSDLIDQIIEVFGFKD